MIYRGCEIKSLGPIGSPMAVYNRWGHCLKEFPFVTSDETIFNWIDHHLKTQHKPLRK